MKSDFSLFQELPGNPQAHLPKPQPSGALKTTWQSGFHGRETVGQRQWERDTSKAGGLSSFCCPLAGDPEQVTSQLWPHFPQVGWECPPTTRMCGQQRAEQGFPISGILETGNKARHFPQVLTLTERMAVGRRRWKFGEIGEQMGIF